MSLVGSLEDLGLGDILQIISLSRKSGLLLLRSEEGEGRIVFQDGLVRAAFVKGESEDLRGLLLPGGFLSEAEFERASATAEAHGVPISEVLAEAPGLSRERIDSLRREHVERSALRMFGWKTGEFSFDVRDEIDTRDLELFLPSGINAQYLTMEATRIGDEGGKRGGGDAPSAGEDIEFGTIDSAPVFSGERAVTAAEEEQTPAELQRWELPDEPPEAASDEPPLRAREALATARTRDGSRTSQLREPPPLEFAPAAESEIEVAVAARPAVAPAAEPEAAAAVAPQPVVGAVGAADFSCLIIIDPDLNALEWEKSVFAPMFPRIHIFQQSDGGVLRIRQYLARGGKPVVIVSEDVMSDPRSGIAGPFDLIRRLRAQAPQMPIFLSRAGDAGRPESVEAANALLCRPPNHRLANRRSWSKLDAEAVSLRAALENGLAAEARVPKSPWKGRKPVRRAELADGAAKSLHRLKEVSDRLRHPSARGEVLSLLLEFAAESFARVAIFMVRDELAVGMAQSGLFRANGPDDEGFHRISIPADEPAWFRSVLERRQGVKAPPMSEGDRKLAALIGSSAPHEAWVAPIESGDRVVALLYADNLPSRKPIGDTTALEIVLLEAGLALDRALLERALADSRDSVAG